MSSKIPLMPPIDLSERHRQKLEFLEIMKERKEMIDSQIKDWQPSFEYWNKRIESYRIGLMLKQGSQMPNIPKYDPEMLQLLHDKLAWLTDERDDVTFYLDKIKVAREIYFTSIFIREGTFTAKPPAVDPEYESVLRFEMKLLMQSNDREKMTHIEREIRMFYIREELIARSLHGTVTMTKDESDRMIENKIFAYKQIIDLLTTRLRILNGLFDSTKDELERNYLQEKIFNLKVELSSKKDFAKRYRERKNILP